MSLCWRCRWSALVLVLFLLGSCARGRASTPTPVPSGDRVVVVASIVPLADFARAVGGERVRVDVLVSPQASPHTFEPTPAQLRALSQARLLVLNGVGLEFWADKVIDAAANPNLKVVITAEGLEILQAADEDDRFGNPHVWLDPINAALQVARIRDALVEVDPAGREVYLQNSARYIEELKALDREIMLTVARFPNKKFIAFHAAWAYFARRYGLEQAAVVERSPGKEPSPAEIARVVATARAIGARAIFAEPQLSAKAAHVIAEESGARVLFLNPLGQPPDYAYIDVMRYNLAQLQAGMGE